MDFISNNVLLVEDDGLLHQKYKNVLQETNFLGPSGRLESAYSFEDGLSKIESSDFDLAILDIELGKGKRRGLDLIRPCRQSKIVPILATGYSDKTLYDRAYLMGAAGYYVKRRGNYIAPMLEESKNAIFLNKIQRFFSEDFVLSESSVKEDLVNVISSFNNLLSKVVYFSGPDSSILAELIFEKCSQFQVYKIDFNNTVTLSTFKDALSCHTNILMKNYSLALPKYKYIIESSGKKNRIFLCEDKDIFCNDIRSWSNLLDRIIHIKLPSFRNRGMDSYTIMSRRFEHILKRPVSCTLRFVNCICSYPWKNINDIVLFCDSIADEIKIKDNFNIDVDILPKNLFDNIQCEYLENALIKDYMKIIDDCEKKGFENAIRDLKKIIAEHEVGIAGSYSGGAKRISLTRAGIRKLLVGTYRGDDGIEA